MALTEDSFLEKAKAIFKLSTPIESTDREWEAYVTNRCRARHFLANDDNDKDNGDYHGAPGREIVLDAVFNALDSLEDEQDMDLELLTSSFKILRCSARFEEEDEPRTVTTHTRIYSVCAPTYVDVHFQYHCRPRSKSIEWFYKLGFRVQKRASMELDYHQPILQRFEQGSFESAYNSGGWRPIAYGFYDDNSPPYRSHWRRVEEYDFKLGHDGILDVHEALWGRLEELPGDANGDEKVDRYRILVETVRLLLAAVGINYSVACDNTEDDESDDMWMLEGLSDRWFAREIRRACGFQLQDDPEKEKKGLEERAEECGSL